jgi:NAD(P)H-nitrite reductase large subunit
MEPPVPPFLECTCTGVTRAQVVLAIARGCRSVRQLQSATGVCTGCRTCYPEIEQLLREVLASPGGATPSHPTTNPAVADAGPLGEVSDV